MRNNIRSELFFLKQFGFNNILLEYIFLSGLDPIQVIFNSKLELDKDIEFLFSEKEKKLCTDYIKYNNFKNELYRQEKFLTKNEIHKIFFKYDVNEITNLLPEKILPLFIYCKGDISLLQKNRKRIAIVGTRSPSVEAIEITRKLTKKFIEKNYVIVSGLAEGTDSIAHETTLENNGKTMAILPTNFDKIYPKTNKELSKKIVEDGLLLTAIGPAENTYKSSFLERNQYVANISDIVLVTETNLKSGTMNTIRNASEAQKKILFVDQKNKEINDKIIELGGEMIDVF